MSAETEMIPNFPSYGYYARGVFDRGFSTPYLEPLRKNEPGWVKKVRNEIIEMQKSRADAVELASFLLSSRYYNLSFFAKLPEKIVKIREVKDPDPFGAGKFLRVYLKEKSYQMKKYEKMRNEGWWLAGSEEIYIRRKEVNLKSIAGKSLRYGELVEILGTAGLKRLMKLGFIERVKRGVYRVKSLGEMERLVKEAVSKKDLEKLKEMLKYGIAEVEDYVIYRKKFEINGIDESESWLLTSWEEELEEIEGKIKFSGKYYRSAKKGKIYYIEVPMNKKPINLPGLDHVEWMLKFLTRWKEIYNPDMLPVMENALKSLGFVEESIVKIDNENGPQLLKIFREINAFDVKKATETLEKAINYIDSRLGFVETDRKEKKEKVYKMWKKLSRAVEAWYSKLASMGYSSSTPAYKTLRYAVFFLTLAYASSLIDAYCREGDFYQKIEELVDRLKIVNRDLNQQMKA